MTTEDKTRPGKTELDGFRGPEPKMGEEDAPSLPVNDGDELPPIKTDDDGQPVKVAGVKEETPPAEPKLTPFDAKRAQIGERFSKVRQGENIETDLDFTKPESVYGKLAGGGEDAPKDGGDKPDPAAADDKTPPKAGDGTVKAGDDVKPEQMTLVVNGKTVTKSIAEIASLAEMSPEEIVADPKRAVRYAQKELATQLNLEESRKLKRETPSRLADDPANRTGSPAPNQERTEGGNGDDKQPPANRETSDDAEAKLLEAIQIGDPKEVAPQLRDYIARAAANAAAGVVERDQSNKASRDELTSNVSAVKGFLDEHPELEGKPTVASAIKAGLDAEYRADLRTVLINEGETEEDADALLSKASVDDIRNAHLRRRLDRNPHVRAIDKTMMETVYDKVRADFGMTEAPKTPTGDLTRQQRKEALPQQPRRASVPPALPPTAATPISRKQAVAEMATRTGRKTSSLAR